MKIFGEILGQETLKNAFAKLQANAFGAQLKSVQEATLEIHRTAIELIEANTDGRAMVRYNPKRRVFVSDPGDPPNTDTGRLVQSIQFDFENDGFTGRVGTNLRYGAWLEFGTRTMEPRPWLSTAIEHVSSEIGEIFARNLRSELYQ